MIDSREGVTVIRLLEAHTEHVLVLALQEMRRQDRLSCLTKKGAARTNHSNAKMCVDSYLIKRNIEKRTQTDED